LAQFGPFLELGVRYSEGDSIVMSDLYALIYVSPAWVLFMWEGS
jgi:hypothetical protein